MLLCRKEKFFAKLPGNFLIFSLFIMRGFSKHTFRQEREEVYAAHKNNPGGCTLVQKSGSADRPDRNRHSYSAAQRTSPLCQSSPSRNGPCRSSLPLSVIIWALRVSAPTVFANGMLRKSTRLTATTLPLCNGFCSTAPPPLLSVTSASNRRGLKQPFRDTHSFCNLFLLDRRTGSRFWLPVPI